MKQVRRILIIGAQGTGKSTLGRMLAQEINLPKLAVEPDPLGDGWGPYGYELINATDTSQLRAPGNKRVVFDSSDKKFLNRIFWNVLNQVIIFDDVLFLLTDSVKYAELSKVLGRARQYGNYVIFTIHGISSVPGPFWNYFTDIIMMKTYDEPGRSQYKIPEFARIEAATLAVNAHPDPRCYVYVKKDRKFT